MPPVSKPYLRDGRAPAPSSADVSEVMRANKARDTAPELLVRRLLRAAGLRHYRLHRKDLPGRPDIAFVRERVVIFLNGCYWHRCLECKYPLPKANREFWKTKFRRNRARDRRNARELQGLGWTPIVIWEHELRESPARVVRRVSRALQRRR